MVVVVVEPAVRTSVPDRWLRARTNALAAAAATAAATAEEVEGVEEVMRICFNL